MAVTTCITGGDGATANPDGCDCEKAARCCHDHDIPGVIGTFAASAPTVDDDETILNPNNSQPRYHRGSFWIDTTGPTLYFAASVAPGAAVWVALENA